jgi:hypothetical protein
MGHGRKPFGREEFDLDHGPATGLGQALRKAPTKVVCRMRLLLMLIPFFALGGLVAVAPQPSDGAFAGMEGSSAGEWRRVTD